MADEKVSLAHFQKVMHDYLQTQFHDQLELMALERALIKAGTITEADLVQARTQVKNEMQSELKALSGATPAELLLLLRKSSKGLQ